VLVFGVSVDIVDGYAVVHDLFLLGLRLGLRRLLELLHRLLDGRVRQE
jgi:hypothetical protein